MENSKLFRDRREAGTALGLVLKKKYQGPDVLVLGIPRGGVEVAHEVARTLEAELSAVITKKLPKPGNPEYAIGAVSEGGEIFLSPIGQSTDKHALRDIINRQNLEVKSRIRRLRRNKPLPEMQNRVVILVDDGIATGSTLVPAIHLCRKQKAKQVVVAAPVAGRNFAPEIVYSADDVVILEQPIQFYAVGQAYEDFHNLPDEEVTSILDQYQKK